VKDQCELLEINRSSVYYEEKPKFSKEEIEIMHKIDLLYTDYPFYGYRRQYQELIEAGFEIGQDRVRRLMRVMDLNVFYPKKTSIPNRNHTIYPYLLRNLNILVPGHVWAADISYIPMAQGFCYLVAIIDWFSRYILSWRLSNSMDVRFWMRWKKH
jgi:putative transposase